MIKFYNTMIIICNYITNIKFERKLEIFDEIAYKVKGKFYRKGLDRLTKEEYIIIPRGFPLNRLNYYFSKKEFKFYKNKKLEKKGSVKCLAEPINEQQKEALNFIYRNDFKRRLTLNLRTDAGKTFVAVKYFCDENLIPLIIVHNTQVLEQWKKRLLEYTDIKEDEIKVLRGSDKFSDEHIEKYEKYKIFITIHKTLSSLIDNDPSRLDLFCKKLSIGIKIYDEAHLELLSTFKIDTHTSTFMNLYLTATLSRSNWLENKLLGYVIPLEDHERFGKGAEMVPKSERYHKIRFIKYSTECPMIDQASMMGRRGFDLNIWANWTLKDNNPNILFNCLSKQIKKFNEEFKSEKIKQCLIVKTLEQAKEFYKLINTVIDEENIGQFSSLTKNKDERFKQLEKDFIIATEKSMGVAIDCEIDILHNFVPYASKSWYYQLVGRLRKRREGYFINYIDKSIESCEIIGNIQERYSKKISKNFEIEEYNENLEHINSCHLVSVDNQSLQIEAENISDKKKKIIKKSELKNKKIIIKEKE